MVKKSFLGRFFGKKKDESKGTKSKDGASKYGASKDGAKESLKQATTATVAPKQASSMTQRGTQQQKLVSGSRIPEDRMNGAAAVRKQQAQQRTQQQAAQQQATRQQASQQHATKTGMSDSSKRPLEKTASASASSKGSGAATVGKSGGNGKPAVKNQKPNSPILEPEILSRTERMASESREQIDVIARKMTTQEEVSIKISDGIKGLSNVLSNIDQRLEEQSQQSFEIARTVKTIPEMIEDLPESSRAGVELLHSISKILEDQSAATKDLGEQLSGIPDTLSNLKEHIDINVEESAKNRNAVQETVESMKSSLNHLEERNQDLSRQQEENTKKLVDSLTLSQQEHQKQIDALMEKNLSTNRLLLYLLYVVVIGLIIIVSII